MSSPDPSTPPDPQAQPPVKLPPITLPKPDGFGDINQQAAVNREKAKADKKRGKEKGARRHPSDPYETLNRKKGGCGSCLLMLVVLLLVPVAAATVWLGSAKSQLTGAGFSWVNVEGDTVKDAPPGKNAYFGRQTSYTAAETAEAVAFTGGLWRISGVFQEKVTFRGIQLILEPGTVLKKGLDVQAAILVTTGAKIEGELDGSIIRQVE
jgi:hypothetical protein